MIKSKFKENHLKKNSLFYFSYVPMVVLLFVLFFLLLGMPQIAAEGMKNGINLCIETLVPSLFPSMLILNCIFNSGILDKTSSYLDRIMHFIFRLPGISFPIIIMSMFGGFPVGAFLIKSAHYKKQLTLNQARRMLLFCVNPGPVFAISTVGYFMIGSEKSGVIIYLSIVLSSLIIGIFSSFFHDGETVNIITNENPSLSDTKFLINAVNDTVKATLNICVWVAVFSCVNSLFYELQLPHSVSILVNLLSEVTNGAKIAVDSFSLPLVCFVISFSGFCIHLQIAPVIIELKMKYRFFLLARIFSGVLSYFIAILLSDVFVQYEPTFSLGHKPMNVAINASLPACAFLLVMCGLCILGDDYVIHKNNKKSDKSNNETTLY